MFIMDKPGRINMIFFLFAAAYFVYVCMGYMATRACENVVEMIKQDRGEM